MSKLLFSLPTSTVPIFQRNVSASIAWIQSSQEFPVRRIYCVGRNYREHALEMGGNPDREAPFFFMKPADSIVSCTSGTRSVPYPIGTSSLHHEGELIVAIGKDGLHIPVKDAMDHVYGYSIGCDLTRRDLQSVAKQKGRPWDAAKGFDYSCPLSPIVSKEEIELNDSMQLVLRVNGKIKQQSSIGSMVYSISEVINHLSKLFCLKKGDLIMTGTPAGVSDLAEGDQVSISCGDLPSCNFVISSK